MGSGFPPGIITQSNVDQKIDPDPKNLFYRYTIPPIKSIPQIRAQATGN
ncbi:hypothetical protein PTKU15_92170 [Paraburkholderia terrae]|nr:hypothetical protein PTKU15_92170 [Paraburkholderia terrae]